MPTTFSDLITACLDSMGDSDASTWSRTERIWKWCIEAIQAFPILQPMLDDHTAGASDEYSIELPVGFREVISVEYPVSKQPPIFLIRKSRLDPDFYSLPSFYDIDHNYSASDYSTDASWMIYFSAPITKTTHVFIQYLANHVTDDLDDDDTTCITVPDEYVDILISYVVAKGYRERLGVFMQDPTAHSSIITQMTESVRKAEENYQQKVQRAQTKLADSRITHRLASDKFDRVY